MIRKCMVLAYLRPEDVTLALNQIKIDSADILSTCDELTPFFEYFNHQWMDKINDWNIFDLDDHVTNNNLEGWHNYVKSKLKSKLNTVLPFWKYVEALGTWYRIIYFTRRVRTIKQWRKAFS